MNDTSPKRDPRRGLPDGTHWHVPFLGTILTQRAIDHIRVYRPALLGPKSPYKTRTLLTGRLYLSRLEPN